MDPGPNWGWEWARSSMRRGGTGALGLGVVGVVFFGFGVLGVSWFLIVFGAALIVAAGFLSGRPKPGRAGTEPSTRPDDVPRDPPV